MSSEDEVLYEEETDSAKSSVNNDEVLYEEETDSAKSSENNDTEDKVLYEEETDSTKSSVNNDTEDKVAHDKETDPPKSSSSENNDMEDDFQQASTSGKKTPDTEKNSFQVLSTEEIVQDMINCLKEVKVILHLPITTTRILLNHFSWDKQRLMERFYDEDQEELFKKAGIINPNKNLNIDTNCTSTDSSQEFSDKECGVCYATVSASEFTGLGCYHRFCKDCWNEYLTTKIMDEGIVQKIACAAHDCNILVDDVSVMKLLKEPKVRLRCQHLITNSFVESNKLLRWCPGPGCENAIKVRFNDMQKVTCECKTTFCFGCGGDWHAPINCKLLKKWLKKCQDDSETCHWIGANTKICPSCGTSIEKNGGCNYICCQKCKHQFCWVCMNNWNSHPNSWNKCNKYEANETDIKAKTQQEKNESALKRYLFYYDRYMNHAKSLDLEELLKDSVERKMLETQEDMSWIEKQFLIKALNVLQDCRQTLMYAYAFAFYLDKCNETEIFETNQRDLEFATETLSGYLERDLAVESLDDIKPKVQHQSNYCEARRNVLLNHVLEGNEADTWEYLQDL